MSIDSNWSEYEIMSIENRQLAHIWKNISISLNVYSLLGSKIWESSKLK